MPHQVRRHCGICERFSWQCTSTLVVQVGGLRGQDHHQHHHQYKWAARISLKGRLRGTLPANIGIYPPNRFLGVCVFPRCAYAAAAAKAAEAAAAKAAAKAAAAKAAKATPDGGERCRRRSSRRRGQRRLADVSGKPPQRDVTAPVEARRVPVRAANGCEGEGKGEGGVGLEVARGGGGYEGDHQWWRRGNIGAATVGDRLEVSR